MRAVPLAPHQSSSGKDRPKSAPRYVDGAFCGRAMVRPEGCIPGWGDAPPWQDQSMLEKAGMTGLKG